MGKTKKEGFGKNNSLIGFFREKVARNNISSPVFWVILAAALLSAMLVVSAVHPTLISFQAEITDTVGNPVEGENLTIKASSTEGCSGDVYEGTYINAVVGGVANVLLGNYSDLNLSYNEDYWLCAIYEDEIVTGPERFRGGQGQISEDDMEADYVNTSGDTMTGDLNVLDMYLNGDLFSTGDVDSYFSFPALDEAKVRVGGEDLLWCDEGATDYCQIGDSASNAEFKIYDGSMCIGNNDCTVPAGDGNLVVEGDIEASSGSINTFDTAYADINGDVMVQGLLVTEVDSRIIADDLIPANSPNLNLFPSSSYVTIDCQDGDGCTVTMDEGGGRTDGEHTYVVCISANVCNFADTAGLSELAGAFAAGQYDSIQLIYVTDRWVEFSRSNN